MDKFLSFIVSPKDSGLRLDQFLAVHCSWLSRKRAKTVIHEKKVTLNAVPVKATKKISAGDTISVILEDRFYDNEAFDSFKVEILYEDEWLLAINKPANMPVQPAGKHLMYNLLDLVNYKLFGKKSINTENSCLLLHRLDKETSGILLLLKDRKRAVFFYKIFEDRNARKEYLAIVYGFLAEQTGSIDLNIGKDHFSEIDIKKAITPDGFKSLTNYRLLKTFENKFGKFSLVKALPETGRQHQIRVHLAAINHPVVGDKIYGPDQKYWLDEYHDRSIDYIDSGLFSERNLLHAFKLTFFHPMLQKDIFIRAPMPSDFREFIRS